MTVRDNVISVIRELVESEGSRVGFASKIGVSKQTVSNWVNGANAPDIEIIAKIANVYGVPLAKMLEGKSPRRSDDAVEYINVPIYGEIAAGTPIDMTEFDDEFPAPARIKAQHPNSGFLRVVGRSVDLLIPDGCLALIDFDERDPMCEDDLYAVCVNGYAATVKSVRKLENGIELLPRSSDPTYHPMVFDYADERVETVTIIGKVAWATMPFDYIG